MQYDFTQEELWFTRKAIAKILKINRQTVGYRVRALYSDSKLSPQTKKKVINYQLEGTR